MEEVLNENAATLIMNKTALLRAESNAFLHLPEQELLGYTLAGYSSCYLLLSDQSTIKVSTKETCVALKFDCFSLSLKVDKRPEEPITPFVTSKWAQATSVLLREDYIENYNGDTTGLIGNNPVWHTSAKVGEVPDHAIARCIVAYGLLFKGTEGRLVVAADWTPTKIEVTTDEEKIATIIGEGDVLPFATYIQRYGSLINSPM